MKGKFTFSKEERLTGKTNIDRLFNKGKSFSMFPFRVFYIRTDNPAEPAARLLIAIPKKKVKHAVARNRLRRLVREVYRLHKTEFFSILDAIRAKVHFAIIFTGDNPDLEYKDVELKITSCLAKLGKITGSES